MNILFVCSRNKWRSKTAEDIFKHVAGYNVRSAGTSESARIKVSEKLLVWADVVFVMEKRHQQILKTKFPLILDSKEILVLDIPDEYQYMNEELVEILKFSVSSFIEI